MPLKRVREYLNREGVGYSIIVHPAAFTTQQVAAAAHVPGHEVAKSVIVKLDGLLAMAVVPGDLNLDLQHMRVATGASEIDLASEWEFKDRFPDCEAGAMPPFGNLYGIPVFVADALEDDEFISFNACNHREMIRLRYDDFVRLVRPRILDIASQRV